MVNTTIQLSCTNFGAPTFPLTITTAELLLHNPSLTYNQTVVVALMSNLVSNTQYNLQIYLYNKVPNIREISPNAEIYVVSKDGLVYEENINYGSAINMPPITNVLSTSVLNDLSTNYPGQYATFKAEFSISQNISTSLSAFTLVLPSPFSFSLGSIPKSSASSLSSTSSNPLYSKPTIV
jgi:hypothetical protein